MSKTQELLIHLVAVAAFLKQGFRKRLTTLESRSRAGGSKNGKVLTVIKLSGSYLGVLYSIHLTFVCLKFSIIRKLKKTIKAESKRMVVSEKVRIC